MVFRVGSKCSHASSMRSKKNVLLTIWIQGEENVGNINAKTEGDWIWPGG